MNGVRAGASGSIDREGAIGLMGEMQEEEAWRIASSSHIVRDRWISLRADDCRDAEGRAIAPYYVLEYPTWVNVLALTPEREVVLIRQYRHGIGRTILEFPGGAMDDADALPVDAARRELLEETGYAADDWLETGAAYANPSNQTNTIHCFLARDARPVAEPRREATEQIDVVLLPLGQLLKLADQGELRHSHHIASLYYAVRALERIADEGTSAAPAPR